MMFIEPEAVQWKSVDILRTVGRIDKLGQYDYRFVLPVPLADWDVYDYWERERFASIRARVKPGDVLYDIGTEQGWCNLLYAATGARMVLVEPTAEFWPNIRATWERNYPGVTPAGFYDGLLGSRGDDTRSLATTWPEVSTGPLIDRNKYEYLHEHSDGIKQTTLDELVERSALVPDAITMDVEGAELLVLRGARRVLSKYSPLVWVSIHPDLGERDYGIRAEQVHDFMHGLGYAGTHLATDHEEHWLFERAS